MHKSATIRVPRLQRDPTVRKFFLGGLEDGPAQLGVRSTSQHSLHICAAVDVPELYRIGELFRPPGASAGLGFVRPRLLPAALPSPLFGL